MMRNSRIVFGNLIDVIFAPRTAKTLRQAYRVAGRDLAPSLQCINHTINQTGYGNPFSDAACVGYIPGYLLMSVPYSEKSIPWAEGNAIMISVIEELLFAAEIYRGEFVDLLLGQTSRRRPPRAGATDGGQRRPCISEEPGDADRVNVFKFGIYPKGTR